MIADSIAKFTAWWHSATPADLWWLTIGMAGQLMFTGRWFVQWIASEKARRSIVPETFWYFSFVGGLMVLAYGVYIANPVVIFGQFGVFIYGRNLYFLWKHKAQSESSGRAAAAPADGKGG